MSIPVIQLLLGRYKRLNFVFTNMNIFFVISRDQNFGINELSAIQDVRNDFSLQDINTESNPTTVESAAAFKEKGKFIFILIS